MVTAMGMASAETVRVMVSAVTVSASVETVTVTASVETVTGTVRVETATVSIPVSAWTPVRGSASAWGLESSSSGLALERRLWSGSEEAYCCSPCGHCSP